MHDVIDSPTARREKTVTAGHCAAGYISLQSLTPEKPKGTFLPPVLTPWRSPRFAAKQLAIIPSASTSGQWRSQDDRVTRALYGYVQCLEAVN